MEEKYVRLDGLPAYWQELMLVHMDTLGKQVVEIASKHELDSQGFYCEYGDNHSWQFQLYPGYTILQRKTNEVGQGTIWQNVIVRSIFSQPGFTVELERPIDEGVPNRNSRVDLPPEKYLETLVVLSSNLHALKYQLENPAYAET